MKNEVNGVCAEVRLILANIPPMSADLLRCAFVAHPWIRLVGTAATTGELAELLGNQLVEIVLVGSSGTRQESTALSFLDELVKRGSTARSIVVSEDMSREDVVAFFRSGARGLLCKGAGDVSLLVKCIGCVSSGQVWANSEQLELLLRSLTLPRSLKVTNVIGDSLLSQREEQVLHLLARGLTNRDIARTLKLSEHTVKNHLFRIFDKLGVSNRMEAVLCAMGDPEHKVVGEKPHSPPVFERSQLLTG